jgi:hypothetical protein
VEPGPNPAGVGDRFETAGLEAFSDGVFAIAITLLLLELSVPADEFDDLLEGILEQWPSYLAYLTSFLTIGVAGSSPRSGCSRSPPSRWRFLPGS